MTEQDLAQGRTRDPRRALVWAAPGVVAALLACGGALAVALTDDTDGAGGEVTAPVIGGDGAVPGDANASCVATYSADDLPPSVPEGQEPVDDELMAFDGTVTGIGPPREERGEFAPLGAGHATVIFDVHEWFAGGDEQTVTVEMNGPSPAPHSGATHAGPAYGPGTRLLVMGARGWADGDWEDALGWGSCGFVRYHDEETSDLWRARLVR